MGNYKSFGDTKFIPEVSPAKLRQFLSRGNVASSEVEFLFDSCVERMYSLPHRHRQVGTAGPAPPIAFCVTNE